MSAATVAAIAKAAIAVLSNEKTRKALGWVIVAINSRVAVVRKENANEKYSP